MGHVDHGHAQALVQVLDFHLHVFAQLFIECAEGFVHQHQLRLEHQCAGQCHALLLTTGQLRRITLGEGVELHHAQDSLTLSLTSLLFKPRTVSGNARFSATVMCGNNA